MRTRRQRGEGNDACHCGNALASSPFAASGGGEEAAAEVDVEAALVRLLQKGSNRMATQRSAAQRANRQVLSGFLWMEREVSGRKTEANALITTRE